MLKRRWMVLVGVAGGFVGVLAGCERRGAVHADRTARETTVKKERTMQDEMPKSEAEWKEALTPEQYHILRQKGTERAFTGKYWNTKTPGVYRCAGCGELLFASDAKYDSGCGWPSFTAPAEASKVTESPDNSFAMQRTEVTCSRCGGHLGHVFEDGPGPTGLRYCINSASINLEPEGEAEGK